MIKLQWSPLLTPVPPGDAPAQVPGLSGGKMAVPCGVCPDQENSIADAPSRNHMSLFRSLHPQARAEPVGTSGGAGHPSAGKARLDVPQLVQTVGELFKEGLAPATRPCTQFCKGLGVPTIEQLLQLFVASLGRMVWPILPAKITSQQ